MDVISETGLRREDTRTMCFSGDRRLVATAPSLFGAPNGPGFGWSDVNAIAVGLEWRATKDLTLRAGYAHVNGLGGSISHGSRSTIHCQNRGGLRCCCDRGTYGAIPRVEIDHMYGFFGAFCSRKRTSTSGSCPGR